MYNDVRVNVMPKGVSPPVPIEPDFVGRNRAAFRDSMREAITPELVRRSFESLRAAAMRGEIEACTEVIRIAMKDY